MHSSCKGRSRKSLWEGHPELLFSTVNVNIKYSVQSDCIIRVFDCSINLTVLLESINLFSLHSFYWDCHLKRRGSIYPNCPILDPPLNYCSQYITVCYRILTYHMYAFTDTPNCLTNSSVSFTGHLNATHKMGCGNAVLLSTLL